METNNIVDPTPRRKLDFSSDEANKEKETTNGENLITEDKPATLEENIPKIGLEFDTEGAAYRFYNDYARATGFSIRRHTLRKDVTGKIIDRGFCCSCEGYKEKDKRVISLNSRAETRTGCKAMKRIHFNSTGKYQIVAFVEEHNGHDLVHTPIKVKMLRSHRSIVAAQKSQIEDIDSSGITPKEGFTLMAKQAGGRENVGFMFEDYKNYLQTKRTLDMKIGDTGGVLEYLQGRQSDDPKFFYAIQVDKEDKIANILWIDARMMVDYNHFGDAICFDTTYRKNKEGRPFALFVGVNHHRQTIIFGAALLYDETAKTFTWLFDTFSNAMSGKRPITILTDQDPAMAKALETTWPQTCHRLCIWHIYQNAATHLSSVFANFPKFAKDFSDCVFEYEEENEFLNAWKVMLEKYELQNNEWLQRLFRIKEKWALVYGRQTFCANMISTQRGESMNSVLKRYVSYKQNLLQFFQHFDRLVDDRRYQELKADLKTCHSIAKTRLSVEILKHASSVYTHEVFELFQDEVNKAYDSTIKLFVESGQIYEYKVTDFRKHYEHTVNCDLFQNKVSCSCKKFELAGILCSHALKVLSSRNITQIPELYIMKRCTKRAKENLIEDSGLDVEIETVNENDEKKMIGVHYKELCSLTNNLVTRAALTLETFRMAKVGILKIINDVDAKLENRPIMQPTKVSKSVVPQHVLSRVIDEDDGASNEITIKGLKKKEKKVNKSGKRLKSGLELNTRGKKQKSLTQLSQDCQAGLCNSDVAHLNEGFSVSPIESFQYSQSFNPVSDHQHHFTPYHSVEDQQMSLTQLLQTQINRSQEYDNFQFNSSIPQTPREIDHNRSGDVPQDDSSGNVPKG